MGTQYDLPPLRVAHNDDGSYTVSTPGIGFAGPAGGDFSITSAPGAPVSVVLDAVGAAYALYKSMNPPLRAAATPAKTAVKKKVTARKK